LFKGAINFITGAGGFLQGLIFGFGGIRIRKDGLHISHPTLPHSTSGMSLKMLDFFDHQFDLDIAKSNFTVVVRSAPKHNSNLCWEDLTMKMCKAHQVPSDFEPACEHFLRVGEPVVFPSVSYIRLYSAVHHPTFHVPDVLQEGFQISWLAAIIIGAAIILGYLYTCYIPQRRTVRKSTKPSQPTKSNNPIKAD
jgi:hypothetical protein